MSEPMITHVDHQFEIHVDDQRAGIAQYVDDNGRRVFFHTEVDDAYSGQGLAGKLVSHALDVTREDGLRIVAVCPYVADYVKSHHDWDELLDRPDRAALDAVSRAQP